MCTIELAGALNDEKVSLYKYGKLKQYLPEIISTAILIIDTLIGIRKSVTDWSASFLEYIVTLSR